jgi:hypothetical protein
VVDRKAFRLDYFREIMQVANASPEVFNTLQEERRCIRQSSHNAQVVTSQKELE